MLEDASNLPDEGDLSVEPIKIFHWSQVRPDNTAVTSEMMTPGGEILSRKCHLLDGNTRMSASPKLVRFDRSYIKYCIAQLVSDIVFASLTTDKYHCEDMIGGCGKFISEDLISEIEYVFSQAIDLNESNKAIKKSDCLKAYKVYLSQNNE